MKGTWGSGLGAFLVIASSGAFAADLLVRKAPPPPPPVIVPLYNWTGFYIGGNLGGAWASGTLTDNFTDARFTGNHSGFIGGGQIGYNWQVAPLFVLGVEGMFDGTSIGKSSNTVTAVNGDVLQGSAHTNWLTTVAGRVGYAANNWLFYGKGGGGWVDNSATVTDVTTGISFSNSNTNSGWLAGAGIEYGFTPHWTMKVEYDHLGLRNWTHASPLFVGDTITLSRQINMGTVGVNYKF